MATTTTTQIPVNLQGYYDRNLLERAVPELLYSLFGQTRPIPKNAGTRANFRRYGNLTPATTPLTEGSTPAGSQLAATDIYVTLDQYGDFVTLSDVLLMTGLDGKILDDQDLLGQQAGETIDIVHRTALMAGTSVRLANGVASRNLIDKAIADVDIDAAIRSLEGNNAKKIREIKVGGAKINTYPLRPAYIGIAHTNCRQDIEALAGFKSVEEYASQGDVMQSEIGATKNIRWLLTTNGQIWSGQGASIGTTGLLGTTNVDVYGTLILAKNAYGTVPLQKKTIEAIIKQLGAGEDPLNQRATNGWKAMTAAKILNDDWMVRIEHGVSAL